jgi:hypothetical protein
VKPMTCLRKSGTALAAVLLCAALATPASACFPGGAIRCAPPGALDPYGRVGGLTRADIDALVNLPGPAVTQAVRRDTARTWEAVRRQSLPPVIAYPADPSHIERKGGKP